MEFGQFENDRKYCFKMFDPFITTFEVYYWKRLGKESSKGTADERRALNEEVKVYFASRLPAIKVELEKYTTDKWFESFTPSIVAWIVDKENPIRMWGNDFAHEESIDFIQEHAATFADSLDATTSNMKILLNELIRMHVPAVQMLKTRISAK